MDTSWRGFARLERLGVRALLKALRTGCVAACAIHLFGMDVVGGMGAFNVVVTRLTRLGSVNRIGELGPVDEKGDFYSGSVGARQRFVAMAIHTIEVAGLCRKT